MTVDNVDGETLMNKNIEGVYAAPPYEIFGIIDHTSINFQFM